MKVILTEGQIERLKNVLKEGVDNKYNREIMVDFNYYRAKYKGLEINDVASIKVRLSFDINIEARSWGIKDISISGIRGPESVDVEISYYNENDEEFFDSYVIQLNWDSLVTENVRSGLITIGDVMDVTLGNDVDGRLIVTKMELPIYNL